MECVFWQSYPKYPDKNMASEICRLWADAKIGGVPQCYLDGGLFDLYFGRYQKAE